MRMKGPIWLFLFISSLSVWISGCQSHPHVTPKTSSPSPSMAPSTTPSLPPVWSGPKPDHVVIVVEENHDYKSIIGNKGAPFINALAKKGVTFTQSLGVTHPSQPNYIALFSGDTYGVKNDHCPVKLNAPNLASELAKQHLSFVGYSEDLPQSGFMGCSSSKYFRKHAPWSDFANVSANLSQPFSSFPKDFNQLPTVAFVIPNQNHDMHDGTIEQADYWLATNMNDYIQWAMTHNSLFILTWDEDDFSKTNHIPTLFLGEMVKPGTTDQTINHYNILRTLEGMYGLDLLGQTKQVEPITGIWTTP